MSLVNIEAINFRNIFIEKFVNNDVEKKYV